MGSIPGNSLSLYPERLPQLNYSLLKETALRKKVIDMGIPGGGPKALLVRRHTEWINLVNANCDSLRPRTKRELIHDLAEWERSQGRVVPTKLGLTANTNSLMSKNFDGPAWGSAHRNEFQRLTQEARKRSSRAVDEKPGSNSKSPKSVATFEDVSLMESASISEISASEKGLNAVLTTETQHAKCSENKMSQIDNSSIFNL